MAASVRQNELFAAETWDVLYLAFTQVNFNASDPPSINAALQNYIQVNYPENFNDWIASSEFVALIDLLSWLAGTLAFKTDISVRENFLETAESRESILRLARFLSYNPARNTCGSGILKLMQISTDNIVYDSLGTNLANTTINWNDPDDSNWYERFTDVLNDAFVGTNPFGLPLNTGTVAGISTQTYSLNALAAANNVGFSATVGGQAMGFELVNGNFVDQGSIFENAPSPYAPMTMFYLNDANGNASPLTGFFIPFKQGTTNVSTFPIATPVENQVIDVAVGGINNTDVWVQTVTDTGTVMTDWTMVPSVLDSNITYNNLPLDQRNIFSVITRDQDQISLRFSDGRFGNAPSGNIRVTYRVSNGLTYQINPPDIDLISFPFTYITATGAAQTLTMTFSLQQTVTNSAPAETEAQIAQRAPGVYATQSRMVSGEDYNNFPLSKNLAVKIKAVNRIYSGHSRYFNLNDPTGTYEDLNLFADDGALYKTPAGAYTEIPVSLNQTPSQILGNAIQPMLQTVAMSNYVNDYYIGLDQSGAIAPINFTWTQSTSALYSTTGALSGASLLIQPGSMLQYTDPTDTLGRNIWVGVENITGTMNLQPALNTAGPVVLAKALPTGTLFIKALPRYVGTITSAIITSIQDKLTKNLSFSLWYDYMAPNSEWTVGAPAVLGVTPSPAPSTTAILLLTVDYIPGLWRIQSPGLQYVFESANAVCFYNNGRRQFDANTGLPSQDTLAILKVNPDPRDAVINGGRGYSLRRNFNLSVGQLFYYADDTPDPSKVYVTFLDSTGSGFPDDPDLLYQVTSPRISPTVGVTYTPDEYLFWSSTTGSSIQTRYTAMTVYETSAVMNAASPAIGTVGFLLPTNTFWIYTTGTPNAWVQDFTGTYTYAIGTGPNVAQTWVLANGTVQQPSLFPAPEGNALSFQWKHYAPSDHRIDPASTNIHDIFVLTASYDTAVRQWIAAGALPANMPAIPTELDLRLAFASMETYRMFSDAIVWRPVRYKYLFGTNSLSTFPAQFKVVPLQNTTVSNGQIQSQIIAAINTYFEVSKWDFGETFYFTEMAAYVHQQLAGVISSFVIVPLASAGTFGDGFEVSSDIDEIFVSVAQVTDIIIIDSNTPANLRIRS